MHINQKKSGFAKAVLLLLLSAPALAFSINKSIK